MSVSSNSLSVLRGHDPARWLEPLSHESRRELRDHVLSLDTHNSDFVVRTSRRRAQAVRFAAAGACALLVAVGTAWAAGALSPVAVFEHSPQQQNATPGSLWDQQVLPASVVEAATVEIPKVGSVAFWFGRTEQGGWCGALRLPDGNWLGTGKDGRDAGGTTPGCWPTRAAVNGAAPSPVYVLDGFDYQENGLDARTDGGSFWRIRYGEITAPDAASITDTTSGQTATVNSHHLFAIAIPDPHPQTATRIHLVAYNASGRIVADDCPHC